MTMTEPRFPVRIARGVPVVIAPDEIDITNAEALRAALLHAAARPGPALVVGNLCPDSGRGHEHAGTRLAGFCILGSVVELLMFEKRCDAGRKRAGPADPAKLCWCLPVIHGGIITTCGR